MQIVLRKVKNLQATCSEMVRMTEFVSMVVWKKAVPEGEWDCMMPPHWVTASQTLLQISEKYRLKFHFNQAEYISDYLA